MTSDVTFLESWWVAGGEEEKGERERDFGYRGGMYVRFSPRSHDLHWKHPHFCK